MLVAYLALDVTGGIEDDQIDKDDQTDKRELVKDVCMALKGFASIKSHRSHLYMAKDTFMTIYFEKVRGGSGGEGERGKEVWKEGMDGRERERKIIC